MRTPAGPAAPGCAVLPPQWPQWPQHSSHRWEAGTPRDEAARRALGWVAGLYGRQSSSAVAGEGVDGIFIPTGLINSINSRNQAAHIARHAHTSATRSPRGSQCRGRSFVDGAWGALCDPQAPQERPILARHLSSHATRTASCGGGVRALHRGHHELRERAECLGGKFTTTTAQILRRSEAMLLAFSLLSDGLIVQRAAAPLAAPPAVSRATMPSAVGSSTCSRNPGR